MPSKAINWILIILCIILTVNIIRSLLLLQKNEQILKQAEDKLQQETELQDDMKRQYARSLSRDYTEKQAREKLNLGKKGEIVLILPSISPIYDPTPTPYDTTPNWKKWIKLFI